MQLFWRDPGQTRAPASYGVSTFGAACFSKSTPMTINQISATTDSFVRLDSDIHSTYPKLRIYNFWISPYNSLKSEDGYQDVVNSANNFSLEQCNGVIIMLK